MKILPHTAPYPFTLASLLGVSEHVVVHAVGVVCGSCVWEGGSGVQVAHPRHRAGACTLNAVGLLPVSGCGDARVAPPPAPPTAASRRVVGAPCVRRLRQRRHDRRLRAGVGLSGGDASRQSGEVGGQEGGAGGSRAIRRFHRLRSPLAGPPRPHRWRDSRLGRLLEPRPAVADRRVGPAGQRGGNLAPLEAEAADALLDELVLVGSPHGAAVVRALDAHLVAGVGAAGLEVGRYPVLVEAARDQQRVEGSAPLLSVAERMRLLQPVPPVAHRVGGAAGQLGGDAAPLASVEAMGLLDERVLLGRPVGAPVIGTADASRRPRLCQRDMLRVVQDEDAVGGRAGRGRGRRLACVHKKTVREGERRTPDAPARDTATGQPAAHPPPRSPTPCAAPRRSEARGSGSAGGGGGCAPRPACAASRSRGGACRRR
mmetsp:Transcript_15912/g.52094  ORF Transcript_15912/g.52094 Transcript_15912/m.52094 type:complete len:429 (-) Transcript_15912:217-1503(-)